MEPEQRKPRSGRIRWNYLVCEFFETRIAPQRVEIRINFNSNDGSLLGLVTSLKPIYRRILIPEGHVRPSVLVSVNAARLPFEMTCLTEELHCFLPLPVQRISMR